MSYILDALRRADAERRRGQSPVLHDVAGLSLPLAARRSTALRLLPWLAGVLVLAGGLLWGWRASGPGGPPGHAPAPVATKAPPAPVATRAPTAPVSAPATPAPVAAVPSPAVPPLPPSPVVRVPPPVVTPPPPTVPKKAPADERPQPASTLPEPQRSAVAQLAFGGAVHSADRTQSFVLLAGRIVREGETLAPGIVLERIGPRALTLRVGERRVERPL